MKTNFRLKIFEKDRTVMYHTVRPEEVNVQVALLVIGKKVELPEVTLETTGPHAECRVIGGVAFVAGSGTLKE